MTTATPTFLPLEALLADRRTLPRDAFLARHPDPVLVITASAGAGELDDAGSFRTQVVTSGLERAALPTRPSVIPVAKRMSDPFQNFIWVGRESRCDVVLPFESVSKLQAQFVKRPGGALDLLDPGSTNGTFVDEARLEKNRPAPIRDAAQIRFGKLRTRFRTAEGLWDELAALL